MKALYVSPLADYYFRLSAQRLEATGCVITCQGSGQEGTAESGHSEGHLESPQLRPAGLAKLHQCFPHAAKTSGTGCGIHLTNVMDVAPHPATSWYLCTRVTGAIPTACGPGDFSIVC